MELIKSVNQFFNHWVPFWEADHCDRCDHPSVMGPQGKVVRVLCVEPFIE
jgi:hypothetical protein